MPPGNHAILALLVAAAARTDYVSPPEIQQWNPLKHWTRHGEETIIRIQKRADASGNGNRLGVCRDLYVVFAFGHAVCPLVWFSMTFGVGHPYEVLTLAWVM